MRLWLVKDPLDTVPEDRRLVAEGIVNCAAGELGDPFTEQSRRMFFQELNDTAESGLLHELVSSSLCRVASQWLLDTQDIEGLNHVFKLMCSLSPNSTWQLLSSRITAKTYLKSENTEGEEAVHSGLHRPPHAHKDRRFVHNRLSLEYG